MNSTSNRTELNLDGFAFVEGFTISGGPLIDSNQRSAFNKRKKTTLCVVITDLTDSRTVEISSAVKGSGTRTRWSLTDKEGNIYILPQAPIQTIKLDEADLVDGRVNFSGDDFKVIPKESYTRFKNGSRIIGQLIGKIGDEKIGPCGYYKLWFKDNMWHALTHDGIHYCWSETKD